MYYKLSNLPFYSDLTDVPSAEVMVLNARLVNGSCFVILVRHSPQIYINLDLKDNLHPIVLRLGEAKMELGIHKRLNKMYRLLISSESFVAMALADRVSIKVGNEAVPFTILK